MKKDSFRVLFIYPNTMMATLVPINLSILSSCLKEERIEVDLFDTTYYPTEEINFEMKKVELLQIKPFSYKNKGVECSKIDMMQDLKEKVETFKPDLIAITLVEDTWELGKSLIDTIKEYKIPVIAGGVFVTFSPDEVINYDGIDMICVGEGEEALVELCKKMRCGENIKNIKNIWIKENDGIIKNPLRSLIDINKLPFINYDIFDKKRLYRPMQGKVYIMAHIELDRGCPYDCTYCEAPHLRRLFEQNGCGKYYRRKTPKLIVEELEYVRDKYNPDYINFNSETFLARPISELKEFAKMYKKIGIPFWCQSRPETVTEENIKVLKSMNCQNLQFGIEHGNEEFRKRILNRHCSNKQMLDGLKIVEKYEIAYTVNNIIGFPDETRKLIFDTIKFNRLISPATMNCYLFTPYKGTRLYKTCIDKGYLKKEDKVEQLLDSVELKMDSISYAELKGLQRTFSLYARMPESEFPKIRLAERFDEEGNKIYEELAELFRDKYFGQ